MGLHIPPKKSQGLKRITVPIQPGGKLGTYRLPNTFDVLNARATAPGRFRLYRDEASRTADALRPPEKDPEPAGGVILDCVFTKERLSLNLSPLPFGSATVKEAPCFWAWEGELNQTLTLELLQVEV